MGISCDKNYINEKLYRVNIEEQKKDGYKHDCVQIVVIIVPIYMRK